MIAERNDTDQQAELANSPYAEGLGVDPGF